MSNTSNPAQTTAHAPDIERLAAFAAEPGGGNPAGVVFNAASLSDDRMQSIATKIGFSETAFIVDSSVGDDERHVRLRYFSPEAEVPFCGHATIATAVALARRRGTGDFTVDTNVGTIDIQTRIVNGSQATASFSSVEPSVRHLDSEVATRLVGLLGVETHDLDSRWPIQEAFAGNWHPVIPIAEQHLFDSFTFDPAAIRAFMTEQNWLATVTVIFVQPAEAGRTDEPLIVQARNLFPVGDITEDPATGSAAAALGAYLRANADIQMPTRVVVQQGRHIGRPSELFVDIPVSGGITVGGTAEFMP